MEMVSSLPAYSHSGYAGLFATGHVFVLFSDWLFHCRPDSELKRAMNMDSG